MPLRTAVATRSLSLPGFISSHLIYANAGRPHNPSWHIQKKIFSGMRIKSNAMAEGTTSSSSEMPVKNCHPQCFSPLEFGFPQSLHICAAAQLQPQKLKESVVTAGEMKWETQGFALAASWCKGRNCLGSTTLHFLNSVCQHLHQVQPEFWTFSPHQAQALNFPVLWLTQL